MGIMMSSSSHFEQAKVSKHGTPSYHSKTNTYPNMKTKIAELPNLIHNLQIMKKFDNVSVVVTDAIHEGCQKCEKKNRNCRRREHLQLRKTTNADPPKIANSRKTVNRIQARQKQVCSAPIPRPARLKDMPSKISADHKKVNDATTRTSCIKSSMSNTITSNAPVSVAVDNKHDFLMANKPTRVVHNIDRTKSYERDLGLHTDSKARIHAARSANKPHGNAPSTARNPSRAPHITVAVPTTGDMALSIYNHIQGNKGTSCNQNGRFGRLGRLGRLKKPDSIEAFYSMYSHMTDDDLARIHNLPVSRTTLSKTTRSRTTNATRSTLRTPLPNNQHDSLASIGHAMMIASPPTSIVFSTPPELSPDSASSSSLTTLGTPITPMFLQNRTSRRSIPEIVITPGDSNRSIPDYFNIQQTHNARKFTVSDNMLRPPRREAKRKTTHDHKSSRLQSLLTTQTKTGTRINKLQRSHNHNGQTQVDRFPRPYGSSYSDNGYKSLPLIMDDRFPMFY
ncbi:hypothetical protein L204_104884 [Cryptococcus depauperatus]